MTKVTKTEAAKLLGIGLTTIKKRMREGTIKFTRITAEQTRVGEQTCFFTYEDLGLQEPAPAPDIAVAPEYDDPKSEGFVAPCNETQPPELSETERKEREDREFAQAYLAREATDSCGNTVDGTNRRFPTKGSQSLLGQVESVPTTRVQTQTHMNPELLGTSQTMQGTTVKPSHTRAAKIILSTVRSAAMLTGKHTRNHSGNGIAVGRDGMHFPRASSGKQLS